MQTDTTSDPRSEQIKCSTKKEAIKKAKELFGTHNWPSVWVIQSRDWFYIENTAPFTRNWEQIVFKREAE